MLTSVPALVGRHLRERHSRVLPHELDMSLKDVASDRVNGDDEHLELGGLDERLQRVRSQPCTCAGCSVGFSRRKSRECGRPSRQSR